MNHLIVTRGKWEKELKNEFPDSEFSFYEPNNFQEIILETITHKPDILTIITEYIPNTSQHIKSCITEPYDIIRIGPESFSHPHCLFSGLLFTAMLHIYNPSEFLPSVHSYATCLKKNIFTSPKFKDLLQYIRSPLAFSLSSLLFALNNNYTVKHVTSDEGNISTDIRYESLKEEFINIATVSLRILEKYRPGRHATQSIISFKEKEVFNIPGKRYLKSEFITGFKKYAPFWKEHLYEDHFALLSAIYTGKEEDGIDDRTWIRILFDIVKASMEYEDKTKISRRLFPIYALYLESVHERPIREHMEKYIEILKEEAKDFVNMEKN